MFCCIFVSEAFQSRYVFVLCLKNISTNFFQDAHNCILDFGESCSYFAVYDGHGGRVFNFKKFASFLRVLLSLLIGAEVSEYASKTFPDFLKNTEMWSKGRLGQALEEAFLKFDETLITPEVMDELKRIAGIKKDDTNDEEGEKLCFSYLILFAFYMFCVQNSLRTYERFKNVAFLVILGLIISIFF